MDGYRPSEVPGVRPYTVTIAILYALGITRAIFQRVSGIILVDICHTPVLGVGAGPSSLGTVTRGVMLDDGETAK